MEKNADLSLKSLGRGNTCSWTDKTVDQKVVTGKLLDTLEPSEAKKLSSMTLHDH